MPSHHRLLLTALATLQLLHTSTAGSGYHYDRPIHSQHTGHGFESLPTIYPLPPVPSLPPLPTPRPRNINSIIAAYLPAQETPTNPFSSNPALSLPPSSQTTQRPLDITPTNEYLPAHDFYFGPNGRQLKQYAVLEIIDNDIAQTTKPYLPVGYFDSIRGAGTSFVETNVQFDARSSALAPIQQPMQSGRSSSSESISLGSGGLGYVRLPNGNVYLGSGSLGYISDQEHQRFVQEVRTRTGAPQPDPLHFGHGPLGSSRT